MDLTDLRQNAFELVRGAQAGEAITVSGRPIARLAPTEPTRWRYWDEIAELSDGPDDPDRARD